MSRSRPSTGNAPPTTLTSIATPPHLARSTLPSSPSSARLRRVAPSPIRVPPTPPLRFSPPVRRNLYPSAHHGQPLTYTSKGPPIASPGASGFDFKAVEFHPDSLIPTPPPSGRPGLTMSDSGMHQWQLEAERTLEDCKSELPHDQSRNNSLSGTEVGVDRRESSVDSFWCAPLILDTRGEFGKMAERTMYMARGGPDVPEELLDDMELQVEIHGRERQAWTNPHAVATHQTPTQTPQNRTADKALTKATGPTPGEWIMSNVPAPVLVNFNEDVFGSAKAGKEVSPGTKTPWTPATQVINRSGDTAASSGGTIIDGHLAPDATPMDRGPSYTGSCATFGPRRRRSSVVADDDDAWSLSLSAYENNEGERSPEAEGSREGKGGNLAEEPVWSVRNDMWSAGYPQRISWSESTLPPHLQRQKDIHESSPASTITELITPDHPVAALPGSTRLARQDIDSPTHASIRAKAFQSQLDGLQLFTNQRNYESVQDGLSKLVTAPLPIPRSRRPTTSDARIPSPAPSTLLPPTIYRPGTSASSASTILPPLFDSFDQTTTIQLWIDQEGTREAHSILKFIRYIKPETWRQKEENSLAQTAAWCESPSRPQPHTFQQGGCLEFGMDPRRRDQWVFHHAALEALPVLRRVTVNEDDRYDYVGRGATLQIKEVGVYAIYGSEERGKVEWKFEYLVKPKVNKAGDDVPNEKVIVPMAFYTTPNFFNPDRALKTHLINMIKKSLQSNIVSEMVKPPHIGKPPPPSMAGLASQERGSSESLLLSQSASSNSASASAMSRTFEAIAKAVLPRNTSGADSSSPSPGIAKFGAGSRIAGSSRPGSRAKLRTPTGTTLAPKSASTSASTSASSDKPAEKKEKPRRRATSLFSRARPFTPSPSDEKELPPLPVAPASAQPDCNR